MTAILDLLRAKYPENAYALFSEVRNATGFGSNRSADAVAMCLWPSRGLELHGFEFKASRSDWLRELKDATKAEAVCRYMDRWWIVTTEAGIVKAGELPKTWGLMVAGDNGLRIVVQAPELQPIALDRPFIASLLRSAQENAKAEIEKVTRPIKDAEYQLRVQVRSEEREERDKVVAEAVATERRRTEDLLRSAAAFEQASGINLRAPWSLGHIGKLAGLLRHDPAGELERLATNYRAVADEATKAADALKALRDKPTEAVAG